MTPFCRDILRVVEAICIMRREFMCYFFGHKWAEWEPYVNTVIGGSRQNPTMGIR